MSPVTVLLVDKSPVFLNTLARFLQELHRSDVMVVGTANSPEEALHQAQATRPQVVLLDVHTPVQACLEIIPRLRSLLPEVRIIALGLHDMEMYREGALAAGADEYVSKATVGTSLLPAIQRVVRADQPREKE